jgi:hypothetical protein
VFAGGSQADAVSCATAASCAVTGTYYSGGEDMGTPQAFVADKQNGTWQNAIEVPGVTALDAGQGSEGGFVSCVSAGNCSLGGDFNTLSYVDDETAGTWGSAQQLNMTALGTTSQIGLTALSCASSVSCSAVGVYFNSSGTLGFQTLEGHQAALSMTGVTANASRLTPPGHEHSLIRVPGNHQSPLGPGGSTSGRRP